MKQKRMVLLVILLMFTFTLTGCGENVRVNANIIEKHTSKEVSFLSDTECSVNVDLSITEGENSYTVRKHLDFTENSTYTLSIKDLAGDFFSEQAQIDNVALSDPFVNKLRWWEWTLIGLGILMFLGLFVK